MNLPLSLQPFALRLVTLSEPICRNRRQAILARLALVVLFSLSCGGARAGSLDLPLLWQADLEAFTETGATVADIAGDRQEEVVIAAQEEVVVLGPEGKEIWRYNSSSRLMAYPAVLARSTQEALLFFANTGGEMICLDGTGREIWKTSLPPRIEWSASAVCDLEGDGHPEVIQTDGAGNLHAFDALSGGEIWSATVDGMPVSPAVGDLDGDGRCEVLVVTGKGSAAAFDSRGRPLWNRPMGGTSPSWATSAPILVACSGGKVRAVAASNSGQVVCLAADGSVVWSRDTQEPIASTLSAGDMDGDGRADVFAVTQLGTIYRFDEEGSPVWRLEMHHRCLAGGALIDLDGDGLLEYGLCSQDGRLMVFNHRAELVLDRRFDHRTINVTPAFGDVNASRPGLEMVVTGGEAGLALCFGSPAQVDSPSSWTAYRGDEGKTGAWLGLERTNQASMNPLDLAWDSILSGEPIRFSVANPERVPLQASASCEGPDGARTLSTTPVLGANGQLSLSPSFSIPGSYRFGWTLSREGGETLVTGSRAVQVIPFANDVALGRLAVAQLRKTAEAVRAILPLSSKAVDNEAQDLHLALDDLQAQVEKVRADPAARAQTLRSSGALVAAARRGMEIAGAVEKAATLGVGTTLLAFEGPLWDNRAVETRVPEVASSPLTLSRTAVCGEHEAISILLFNLTDREIQARVKIVTSPNGPTLKVHRSIPVVSSLGEQSWDPLPELDESNILSIPPLSTSEIWLDVDTEGTEPGPHRIALEIAALNGAGLMEGSPSPETLPSPTVPVEIDLHLLDFEMAPTASLRLCAWAALDPGAIGDLLDHGGNVFVCPHGAPVRDDRKNLTGFDYTGLDKILTHLKGEDVILLLSGIPSFPEGPDHPGYRESLKTYLEDLSRHLADWGFDKEHFALYPIDEPGGMGWASVNSLVKFGEQVRAVDPEILIYMDGGGEKAMFEAMAPVIDIWCPALFMLPEDSPEMRVIRSTGKTLWSYDCVYSYSRPVGANLKNINIVGQYRNAALFAFRYGASGIGFWSYNYGEDLWGRTQLEYPLVYSGRSKPVTSRRWEAVREGVEDYRILAALKDRLADPSLSEENRQRIRALLEEDLKGMIEPGYQAVRLGLSRQALLDTSNENLLNEFRRQTYSVIEALSGAK